MNKKGFTLAEVLITLGIIGVVAAITLPTLIQNYQKQVYVNGLKKAISTSQNMLKQMQADEGASDLYGTKLFMEGVYDYTSEDGYGNPNVFVEIVPKYLKVVKICKSEECTQEYTPATFTNHNKPQNTKGANKVKIWGRQIEGVNPVKDAIVGFYTADGEIFYMAPHSGYGPDHEGWDPKSIFIFVDVNGSKGPNIENVDLFKFSIKYTGQITDDYHLYGSAVWYLMSNGWKMDY